MSTRREALRALACLPLLLRGAFAAVNEGAPRAQRGFACALGELADARGLPAARRDGEHLALALAGSEKPAAEALLALCGAADAHWLELSPLDRGGVEDGPLAERIRTAASVALIEGPMLDWLVTLWPARRSSAVLRAIAECAATGGRVVGRGSTSFLIGGGCVARGATRDAIGEARLRAANPREQGEATPTPGLYLGGEWLLDTATRAQGSALRLLSCLIEAHLHSGLLLAPRSIVACDLESREWSALGEDALLHLDLSRARRLSASIEGLRLSVMAAGDSWSRGARALRSSAAAAPFAAPRAAEVVEDALALEVLREAPVERREWRDSRARVALARTSDTRLFAGPGSAGLRAHALALDVALARGRWGELG